MSEHHCEIFNPNCFRCELNLDEIGDDVFFRVEASSVWCPDRTVWSWRPDEKRWACECCGERRPDDELIDKRPVVAAVGVTGENETP